MNAKEIKFLQVFESFAKTSYLTDLESLKKYIKSFAAVDFNYAVNIWEYIAVNETALSSPVKGAFLSDVIFTALCDIAPAKTLKALSDNSILRRTAYQYSAAALSDARFTAFTDAILSSKFDAADDIIRILQKNTVLSFGEYMKKSIDRIIVELLKKNPKKIEMSRKLNEYLNSAVKKIKTDERTMLEQRLREIT